jgi:hypothetical protein
MNAWIAFMRPLAYIAIGAVLVSMFFWAVFPLGVYPIWMATLTFICVSAAVGLVWLTVVGIIRLGQYFAKPS